MVSRMGSWILWVCLCASSVFAEAVIDAPRPLDLTDTALISYLGGHGEGYWQLVPACDSSGEWDLLRNGTSYTRVPAKKAQEILDQNPNMFNPRESAAELDYRSALSKQNPAWDWVDFSLTLENPLFALPEGFWVGYDAGMSYGGRFYIEDGWSFKAAKRVGFAHFEAEVRTVSEYMNMQKVIRETYGSENFSNWRFGFSVALPLVKYTVRTETGALPEYYWLDTDVEDLYFYDDKGRILSQFANGLEGHASNLSHSIEFRWWALRYRILFDGEVYSAPVHIAGFEGLPMGIGTWGVHVIQCNGLYATGLLMDFGPYALHHFKTETTKPRLFWNPVHVELDFISWDQYRMSAGFTVGVDNLWN